MDPNFLDDQNLEQQNKRKNEKEQIEKQKKEFADWWSGKYGLHRSQYQRIDARDKNAEDESKFLPGLRSLNTMTGLLEPGVYRQKDDGQHHYDQRITQDGKIKPLFGFDKKAFFGGPGRFGGAINKAQFDQGYGESLDIAAAGRGKKSVTADFDKDSEGNCYVSEKYLLRLMNLAAKRGLTVEFGPNIEEYLDSLKGTPKGEAKRKRIYDAKMALERFQEADKLLEHPGNENYSFDKWKTELDDPAKHPKLPEPQNVQQGAHPTLADAKAHKKAEDLKQQVYGAQNLSEDAKLEKIKDQIQNLETRMGVLDSGRKELSSCLDAHKKTLEDPAGFIAKNPVKKHKTRAKIAGVAAATAAAIPTALVSGTAGAFAGPGGAAAVAATVTTPVATKAYNAAYKSALYDDKLDRRIDRLYQSRAELTRDPAELVRKVKDQMDATEPNRQALLKSLENELKDLQERNEIWKKELQELKRPLEAKQTAGTALSDAEKAQMKKINDMLTKVDASEKSLEKHKDEIQAAKQLQTVEMNAAYDKAVQQAKDMAKPAARK